MITAKESYVDVEAANLYCRFSGKGEPVIILHGGPGLSMDYLLPGLEKLAQDNLVVFYDQRGNGTSSGVISAEYMTLEVFTNDLCAVVEHFHFDKFRLIGHSWGAYLAMVYAIAHGDKISELTLLNPIPVHGTTDENDPYERMIQQILDCDETDNTAMISTYRETLGRFFYNPSDFYKLGFESMGAEWLMRSARIHKLFENNFFRMPHDLRNSLKKLTVPTKIIHGIEDVVPESVSLDIQLAIPNSKVIKLKSGHFPHVEIEESLLKVLF